MGNYQRKRHTVKNSGVDASTDPPNQTANLWIGWLSTLTSTGCDWNPSNEKSKYQIKLINM
jgi:hypothetical protein